MKEQGYQYTTDLLVIGCGFSGMWAAMRARDFLGDVLVVDKGPRDWGGEAGALLSRFVADAFAGPLFFGKLGTLAFAFAPDVRALEHPIDGKGAFASAGNGADDGRGARGGVARGEDSPCRGGEVDVFNHDASLFSTHVLGEPVQLGCLPMAKII